VAWSEEAREGEGYVPSKGGITALIADYVALMKPAIISLLLVTALGGMMLAARGWPPFSVAVAVLLGGTLAAGGANALNQYLDRDIDDQMRRTRKRPLPSRRVTPQRAAVFGIVLNVVAFVLLWSMANLLAAAVTLAGSLFYVLVYTGWLKRSTTQNIVIGGAAGAVPPMVGWAAVTGSLGLPAWYMFAIVFFWTPPHFWALALLIRDDYEAARVPMLPVVQGVQATAWAILLYSFVLVAITLMFYVTREVTAFYLITATLLGTVFILYAYRLYRDPQRPRAVRLYTYSLLYLALLFIFIMVDGSVFLS
jgi:protoheme IX farnesyltransferase